MILLLTLLLVGPYVALTVVGRLFPRARTAPRTRARAGLSLMLLATASGHFLQTEAMARMLPPAVPGRVEIIYATGVFELLGAVGVWIPAVSRLAGACLVAMLIGVLPANVYSALNRVPFGGHDAGPIYLLVRIPFQLLVIGWVYHATGQRWLAALRRTRPSPAAAKLP